MYKSFLSISGRNSLLIILSLTFLISLSFAQDYQVDVKIVSGGTGNMSGLIPQGTSTTEGTVSIVVDQPIISTETLEGAGYEVDLGFWSPLLRTPGTPIVTASYDTYPDKVKLEWRYDPNDPPGTENHKIYREYSSNNVPIAEIEAGVSNYSDLDLPAGQQFEYLVRGSNRIKSGNTYQPIADAGQAFGKTSSNGSVSGFINTTLNSPIPNARVTAYNQAGTGPAWGKAVYLNGVDNAITMSDRDEVELLDQVALPAVTMEMWFRPEVSGLQTLISKGSNWELGMDVEDLNYLYFSIDDTPILTTDHTLGNDEDQAIRINEWNYIALVRENSNLRIYINGWLATINGNQKFFNLEQQGGLSSDLMIGGGPSGEYFNGLIDDFRCWNEARDNMFIEPYSDVNGNGEYDTQDFFTDINGDGIWGPSDSTRLRRDYNRLYDYKVEGEIAEPTLTACFHMDIGSGQTLINSANLDLNATFVGDWSTNQAPTYPSAYTDEVGAFQIKNLNFGDGRSFRIVPEKAFHEFSPPYQPVSLNQYTPTNNEVDFDVVNMISLSGYVTYDTSGTGGVICGEPDVEIWTDGEFRGTRTDVDGYYILEVEPGRTITLQPKKGGRELYHFAPQTKTFFNVITPQSQSFVDKKKRTLRGTVTGGACELALGPAGVATVNLSSSCFSASTVVDAAGNYTFANIPPMPYSLAVAMNTSLNDIPNLTTMNTYFQNQGENIDMQASYGKLDSVWLTEEDTVKFNYRSPINFRVDGWSQDLVGNNGLNQNDRDTLDIFVYESYYGGECPLDSGIVHIKDWISDRTVDGDEDSDTLYYGFIHNPQNPAAPSLRYGMMAGLPRLEGDHKKNIEIIVSDPSGIRTKSDLFKAVVLGHRPNEPDFATTAPEIPLLILRRPPGDGSWASFGETSSASTSFSMTMTDAETQEANIEAKLGVETEINIAPWGVGTSFELKTEYTLESGFSTTNSLQNSSTMQITTTTSTEYTTATSVDLMGDRGTIFVGGAMNLLYGETIVLEIVESNGSYDYVVDSQVLFIPDGFETTYIYSRGYVEDLLIPELEFLSETDTALTRSIERWNYILNYEDSLKWATTMEDNYSFSGGGQAMTITSEEANSQSLVFEEELEMDESFSESMGFEAAGFGLSGKAKVSTKFTLGSSEEYSWTNTTTSSYSLMDDDHGDDYTVDVGYDPVYGTPVFNVVAGNSSCPYEEWTNHLGVVTTTPMDEPGMSWMTPSTALNIHPDGVAEFDISLNNLADFSEPRTYYLSYLSASNTHGATILINGQDAHESAPIPFELEYLGVDSAHITVSRPDGSDVYEFDNLLLKFAPECETNYAGVTQGYTIGFSAHFARPCTEAEIYQPNENWIMNTVTGDTMTVIVEGYDLGQSYFDELLVQYSLMGDPVWYGVDTLVADTLRHYDRLYSQLSWDIGDLDDGTYDIRLQSKCLSGNLNNYMDAVRGIIDTQVPEVLGSPEPVDGILNFNDAIALNFTEAINPVTVENVNVTLYDNTNDEAITDFELSVSENRLVITPTLLNRYIENHTLVATLIGHEDLNGNPGEPVEWTFTVDRNPVAWSTGELSHIAFQGEPEPVTLQLNNTGSIPQDFRFSSTPSQDVTPLPEWLTIYPMEGSLNPGGSFDIQLDVNPTLNNGEYSVIVYAVTDEGYEPLNLDVVSMCPYPDWSIDFTQYEYSMNVTANLYQMSTLSNDIYDRVAAYVDDECRGWAQLEYVPELDDYQAFITVFSNDWSGEEVQFHIWDRTECAEYWQADTSVIFIEGEAYGSPMEPIALNATGELGQNIGLNSGFTWMSLNLDAEDMSVASILEGIEASPGDRIIGHEAFAQYSDSSGWSGTLTALDNYSMYQLDLENADELIHVGFPIQPDITNIEIASGWNWISYLPVENINVNHALSSLMNSTDDLIKNQSQYAQFVDGIGWLGSLNRMYPGTGYKLESFEGGILNYPVSESITLARSIASSDPLELPELPWDLHERLHFQNNMTITALLESDTIGVNNPADAVAAFVGEEIRGVARPEYIPALDAYRVFLMIQGEAGDEISLKIWDAENEIEYRANQAVSFQADASYGTPLDPYSLTRAPLGIGDKGYVPEVYSLAQNYPNPFNPRTTLGFGLPEDSHVSICIYNMLGQEVRTLVDEDLTAGYRHIIWNSLDNAGHHVPSGIYITVMQSGSFREVRKMVMLK